MFIGQAAKRGSSLSLSTRRRRRCLHTIYVPFLSWRIFSPFMWLRFWRNKREDSSSGTLSISFHLLFLSETVVEGEFLGGSFKNCLNDRKLILWIFNETRNYEYIDNNVIIIRLYILYISSERMDAFNAECRLILKWRREKLIRYQCKYFHFFERRRINTETKRNKNKYHTQLYLYTFRYIIL